MTHNSLSPILFRYIGQRFLAGFGIVYGGLLAVIYFIDAIEIMRGLAKYNSFSLVRAAKMTALKLPEVGLQLMPFAVFIAAVFTFWRLTRTSELVVVRATGVSAWQFLFAPLIIAVLLAILKMAVLNPVSTVMLSQYEEMDAKYVSTQGNSVNIAKTGLWLRQQLGENEISIIHAQNIKLPEWSLSPVTAFFFNRNNQLTHRIDSKSARLMNKEWGFFDAWVNTLSGHSRGNSPGNSADKVPQFYSHLALPTEITVADIENRFASPKVISFWRLPEYARIMEMTGFEANPLWAYFYGLLAEPFLNAALIILAAALALRSPREQKGWGLVSATIAFGFVVFFLGDFLEALGISERLPLVVAAFAPATISLLMGLTALLNMEDG